MMVGINAGITEVATRIPIIGHSAFAMVADSFYYVLDSTFIPDALAHRRPAVWYRTSDKRFIYGLTEVSDPSKFAGPTNPTIPMFFCMEGSRILIDKAPFDGGWIYVDAPIWGKPIQYHDDTTNVHRIDREAVVYWAIYFIGSGVSHPAANPMLQAFIAHVAMRGGNLTGLGAQE